MRRHTDRLLDAAAIVTLLLLVTACTWRIGLAGRVLAGGDVFTYFYPYWAEATRAIRAGRLPLWNPTLFMGVPFLANSQVGFFYPLNWPLWLLLSAHRSVHVTVVLHLGLAALNAYLWGRKALRLGRIGSWTVGAVFALGGYLGAQVEHLNQLQGLAWLPLVLMLSHRVTFPGDYGGRSDSRAVGNALGFASMRRRLRLSCLLALVIGAVLLAGHTQTAFISLFGAATYAAVGSIARSVRTGSWGPPVRVALLLSVAVGLSAALAAVQLLPTWGLSRLSVRAQGLPFNERVSFSLSPAYAGRALLPDLVGTVPPDHLEHVAYVGTVGLLLALIGVMMSRGRRQEREATVRDRRPEYALILVGLFFAFGLYNPVYLFLARFVPGFAHFRVPARWLALYTIGVAGLVGRAVEGLLQGRAPDNRRVLIAAGLLALLILWGVLGARLGAGGDLHPLTVLGWVVAGVAAIGLLMAARRQPGAATLGLLILLTGELFLASGALPRARATAPQAFTSLRPAVAHLLAAGSDDPAPRDRFLSMSDTTFDPGDLPLIRMIYGSQLSDDQLYDYIIATKQKEIISPNLPLAFGVPAVDGYGGGLLPLSRYVMLQHAFLPADDVSIDGRLRENLTVVPEGRWLSLFNVRYVITDKLRDAWIDDVFYDLQFRAQLSRGDVASVADVPTFEATALGVVSHLDPGAALPDGVPVGLVRVGFADGDARTFELHTGEDVSGGADQGEAGAGMATRLRWLESKRPITVTVEAVLPAGEWTVRGMSLIDDRTGSFHPLVLSDDGRYRLVHSGDVKIYENLDVLPRAFIVSKAQLANDDEAALEAMKDPQLDLSSQVVLLDDSASCPLEDVALTEEHGRGGAGSQTARATITAYRPEQVVVEAVLERQGYLLLTDAHYPGWRVTVDGEPASLCRADLLFRAVPLGPGEHRVVFTFRPSLLPAGMLVTLAGVIGLLLVWHEQRIVETIVQCYNRMQA
jgi:hypothetical protein